MRKIIYSLSLLLLALFSGWSSLSQTGDVFLHLDRPYYLSDDSIRFSAYHFPYGQQNEVLYIQLNRADGSTVFLRQLVLKEGKGSSIIPLEKNMKSGEYILIAFTNEMKLSPERCFTQRIQIINRSEELSSTPDSLWVKFFPEGGNLVANRLNHLAYFSSVPTESNVLLCSTTDTLGQLKLQKGFGNLLFTPIANNDYHLKVIRDGDLNTFPLPKAITNTLGIKVLKQKQGAYKVTIFFGEEFSTKKLNVSLKRDENILFSMNPEVNPSGIEFTVPSSSLPAGINRLEIRDQNDKLIASTQLLGADVSSSLQVDEVDSLYGRREKIRAAITLRGTETANVSIAIRKASFFEAERLPTIDQYSYLNLSSKLVDEIIPESINENSSNLIALDSLFQPLNIQKTDYILPENTSVLHVLGNVSDPDGNPLADTTISLTILKDDPEMIFSRTNSSGLFYFQPKVFQGEAPIILKVKDAENRNQKLLYQIDDYSLSLDRFPTTFTASDAMIDYLRYANENRTIQNTYRPDGISTDQKNDAFSSLSYEPDFMINLDEYITLQNFQEVIREFLPGVKTKTRNNRIEFYLNRLDKKKGFYTELMENQPLRLIDGVPVFDNDLIMGLSPESLKRIYITHEPVYLNGFIFDGVFEVWTQKKNFYETDDTNHFSHELNGAFTQGNFALHNKLNVPANMPDFRPILLWNPSMNIRSGSNPIEFYTSDDIGVYIIDIQGIDGNNQPMHVRKKFKVMN